MISKNVLPFVVLFFLSACCGGESEELDQTSEAPKEGKAGKKEDKKGEAEAKADDKGEEKEKEDGEDEKESPSGDAKEDKPSKSGLPAFSAPSVDPAKAKALNSEGLKFHRKKDYASAIGRYEEAVKMEPKHVLARYNMACALSLSGDSQRSLHVLEDLAKEGCEDCLHQLAFARTDKDFKSMWEKNDFIQVTAKGKLRVNVKTLSAAVESAFATGNAKPLEDHWPAKGTILLELVGSPNDPNAYSVPPTKTNFKAFTREALSVHDDVRGGWTLLGFNQMTCNATCCTASPNFDDATVSLGEVCVEAEDGTVKLSKVVILRGAGMEDTRGDDDNADDNGGDDGAGDDGAGDDGAGDDNPPPSEEEQPAEE